MEKKHGNFIFPVFALLYQKLPFGYFTPNLNGVREHDSMKNREKNHIGTIQHAVIPEAINTFWC